jgi:mRNA interferase MazF
MKEMKLNKFMTLYKFGDILILNFPFAEGTGTKRRPVVVIKDTNDGDLLVAKVTSKTYRSSYDFAIREWVFANLQTQSTIRIHKIQTISSGLIVGKIGSLHPSDRKAVRHILAELLVAI